MWKILLKLSGWTVDMNMPEGAHRSVMVAAPHTSNWDAFFMLLAGKILGINVYFAIKKSWLRFPMNLIFKPLGALGVDRSPRKPGENRRSLVDAMADLFDEHENMVMVVAPEGSRSYQPGWKTGFYYTALKAGVPITLGYLDYKTKTAGVRGIFWPTGDMEADIAHMQRSYRNVVACHPEKTVLGPDMIETDLPFLAVLKKEFEKSKNPMA